VVIPTAQNSFIGLKTSFFLITPTPKFWRWRNEFYGIEYCLGRFQGCGRGTSKYFTNLFRLSYIIKVILDLIDYTIYIIQVAVATSIFRDILVRHTHINRLPINNTNHKDYYWMIGFGVFSSILDICKLIWASFGANLRNLTNWTNLVCLAKES
jgi:hypothetical protein